MRTIAKTFIALGLLGALVFLARGLYYAPNDEDIALQPAATVYAAGGESVVGTVVGTEVADKEVVEKEVEKKIDTELPSRLLIPRLNIDADIQRLGLTTAGNMAAPNNFVDTSWYKYGTVPGKIGSAVIAGHEDNAIALDGVFKHLEDLKPGDDVYVVRADGVKLHFKVIESKIFPYNLSGESLIDIFNHADKARLNLITCAGKWLAEAHTNDQRLVVYTELVTN